MLLFFSLPSFKFLYLSAEWRILGFKEWIIARFQFTKSKAIIDLAIMYSSIIAVHTEIRQNTAHTRALQCFAEKHKSGSISCFLRWDSKPYWSTRSFFCFLEGALFTPHHEVYAQGAHAAKTHRRKGKGQGGRVFVIDFLQTRSPGRKGRKSRLSQSTNPL